TEFSDIEWEGNGWLDYWRQPKPLLAPLADVNAEVALIATPRRPNAWRGDEVAIRVAVANTSAANIAGAIRWRLAGSESGAEGGLDGGSSVGTGAGSAGRAAVRGELPVTVSAPAVDETTVL